jgi:hypothetical protein
MPRPVLGNYDGAVVSGFLFLGLGLCSGLAPLWTLNVLKTLLNVSSPSLTSYDNRHKGRVLPVALWGYLYYGIDAETGEWVAKIAPLHRTAVGSCGSS